MFSFGQDLAVFFGVHISVVLKLGVKWEKSLKRGPRPFRVPVMRLLAALQ